MTQCQELLTLVRRGSAVDLSIRNPFVGARNGGERPPTGNMNRRSDEQKTYFAPAGRDSLEELHRLGRLVEATPLLQQTINAIGEAVVILNQSRQIVAANRTALDCFPARWKRSIGRRPGELLGCSHAAEGPDGCGSSQNCSVCGAVQAVFAEPERAGSRDARMPHRAAGTGGRCARSEGACHDRASGSGAFHDLLA